MNHAPSSEVWVVFINCDAAVYIFTNAENKCKRPQEMIHGFLCLLCAVVVLFFSWMSFMSLLCFLYCFQCEQNTSKSIFLKLFHALSKYDFVFEYRFPLSLEKSVIQPLRVLCGSGWFSSLQYRSATVQNIFNRSTTNRTAQFKVPVAS